MSIQCCATADLPSDVLNPIQSLLPLDDYVRFPAVCARWRSAAKRNPKPPSDDVPWLFTFYFAASYFSVFRPSPANGRPLAAYRIPIPSPKTLPLSLPNIRVISSLGHRLFLSDREKLLLMDPFSSSWTQLSHDVISKSGISVSLFRKLLASPDYDGRHGIALALHGSNEYSTTAYSTNGGPWIDLNDENKYRHYYYHGDDEDGLVSPLRGLRFIDAVHYKGSLFFALRKDEEAKAVVALDFSSLSSSCPFPAVVDVTLNLVDDYPSATRTSHGIYMETSLVISSPYLYLIRWSRRLMNLLCCHPTGEVYVYRLPLPQEEDDDGLLQRQRWIQVNELSGCSFFLGENDSVAVSTRDCPDLRPDRICFPFQVEKSEDFPEGEDIVHKLIYNLADGIWEEYCGSRDHKARTMSGFRASSSTWMMPCLLPPSASSSELLHPQSFPTYLLFGGNATIL